MAEVTNDLIQQLSSFNEAPCLSLYMPTHQTHPDNTQDPILFKKLLQQMEESLLQKYAAAEAQKHLDPLRALTDDNNFWNHSLEGLAVFSAKGLFKVVRLHASVEKLAMVADSFHTKPLRKYLQSSDNFHVLGLTRNEIRLYQGSRRSLFEVELHPDIPKTLTDALGNKLTDPHLTVASYGGSASDGSPMHHGQGGKNPEIEKDAEKFFRIVAEAIYDHYSKATGWPLILAALPEHHNLFHSVNKNRFLLEKGVTINPFSVSTEQLAQLAWEVLEPEYNAKLESLAAEYQQAKANDKGSDDYKEVAVAAIEGRVETLLVEADRIIAARVTNLETGNTQKKELTNPRVDDLLDDMGELVIKMGGTVMVLPADKMPSEKGLAAIYRY